MDFLSSEPEGPEELTLVYYDEAERQIHLGHKPLVLQRLLTVRTFPDTEIAHLCFVES